MINIQSKQNTPITVIRAASGSELTEYEKKKLNTVEEYAQQNKIEIIKVDGKRATIDSETKTANINLNLKNLAFKSAITSEDVDSNSLFFIKCEL